MVNGPCTLTYKYKYVTWTKHKISNGIYQIICRKWENTWPCFYCFSIASKRLYFLVQYSQVLGLRMRRWMGPSLVDLMIFQASWCMSPSREHPLMDRTSSPTSISPDSSAAPPNGEEYRRSALLKDTLWFYFPKFSLHLAIDNWKTTHCFEGESTSLKVCSNETGRELACCCIIPIYKAKSSQHSTIST